MISVLIVDDHNLTRTIIRSLLEPNKDIEVIGEAKTGEEAIQLTQGLKPQIILMDVQMPGIGGLETTHRLLRANPYLKIIILTAYENGPFPSGFVRAGAAGYLTKKTSAEELAEAIHTVFAGHSYITPLIAQQLALSQIFAANNSPLNLLTERELQIMWMTTKGFAVDIMATQLHLSTKTINTYRYRLFDKLNVRNDVELTHLAVRCGMLDD